MKIFLLLITLFWSMSTHAFPWFFGNDAAVLLPSKIQNTSSTGATIDFTGNDINLFTPGNSNQLFLDTTGVVGLGTNAPSSTLDVVGAIESNGAGVSNSNQFVNGSLEDAPDFSLTNGTQAAETTNCLTGKCALLEPDGSGLIADKCFTSTQWEGLMAQVTCDAKSDTAGTEICWYDGTTESNCLTLSVNEWQSVKIFEQVLTGASACVRVKTVSTTGDTFIDNCELSRLKVDGTAKVETQSYHIEQQGNAMTDIAAGEIEYNDSTAIIINTGSNLIQYRDGGSRSEWFANKKVTINDVAISGENTIASNTATIKVYDSSDVLKFEINGNTQSSSAGLFAAASGGFILEVNEYFTVSWGVGIANNTDLVRTSFTVTHYEQKSVLSDATAESTFTDWASYTPSTSQGFGTLGAIDLKWKRVGTDMLIQGTFVSGTSTATEARLELPTGHTTRSDLPSRTVAGKGAYTGTGGVDQLVLVEPSRTYMNFGIANVGTAGLSAANGSQMVAAGQTYGLLARFPIEGWSAKPQIVGTFKPAVRTSLRSNATITTVADLTDTYLDYDSSVSDPDSNFVGCGSGNVTVTNTGCKYVCPETGEYFVNANVRVGGVSFAANKVLDASIKVNNVAKKVKRQMITAASTAEQESQVSGVIHCNEDDYIEIVALQNSGSTANFSNNTERNFWDVFRIDQAGRLSQEEPKKIQTKILSADVTTDNFDISDFTYTGLTIGKFYRISGQLVGFNTGVADNFALVYNSAAAGAGTIYGECKLGSDATLFEFCGVNVVFKAVSTTLYFHTESLSPAQFNGDASKKESFVQLEEVNMVETNQW